MHIYVKYVVIMFLVNPFKILTSNNLGEFAIDEKVDQS